MPLVQYPIRPRRRIISRVASNNNTRRRMGAAHQPRVESIVSKPDGPGELAEIPPTSDLSISPVQEESFPPVFSDTSSEFTIEQPDDESLSTVESIEVQVQEVLSTPLSGRSHISNLSSLISNSVPTSASPTPSLLLDLSSKPTKKVTFALESTENPEQTKRSSPLSPTLKWIITLFAGRRKTKKTSQANVQPEPEVEPTPPPTEERNNLQQQMPALEHGLPNSVSRTRNGRRPPPVPPSSASRGIPQPSFLNSDAVTSMLNHPRPEILNTAYSAARYTELYQHVEPAPAHPLVGYAVVQPDVFTPDVVITGFNVPGTQPLPKKRPANPSRLHDRAGDNWGRYERTGERIQGIEFGGFVD